MIEDGNSKVGKVKVYSTTQEMLMAKRLELAEREIDELEKENNSLKEERVMLRKIAYAYKNLDCHSTEKAVEAITKKGWQAQLSYEKWCEENGKEVGFLDWKELEKEG